LSVHWLLIVQERSDNPASLNKKGDKVVLTPITVDNDCESLLFH
jgi:hypothetical protein